MAFTALGRVFLFMASTDSMANDRTSPTTYNMPWAALRDGERAIEAISSIRGSLEVVTADRKDSLALVE